MFHFSADRSHHGFSSKPLSFDEEISQLRKSGDNYLMCAKQSDYNPYRLEHYNAAISSYRLAKEKLIERKRSFLIFEYTKIPDAESIFYSLAFCLYQSTTLSKAEHNVDKLNEAIETLKMIQRLDLAQEILMGKCFEALSNISKQSESSRSLMLNEARDLMASAKKKLDFPLIAESKSERDRFSRIIKDFEKKHPGTEPAVSISSSSSPKPKASTSARSSSVAKPPVKRVETKPRKIASRDPARMIVLSNRFSALSLDETTPSSESKEVQAVKSPVKAEDPKPTLNRKPKRVHEAKPSIKPEGPKSTYIPSGGPRHSRHDRRIPSEISLADFIKPSLTKRR